MKSHILKGGVVTNVWIYFKTATLLSASSSLYDPNRGLRDLEGKIIGPLSMTFEDCEALGSE